MTTAPEAAFTKFIVRSIRYVGGGGGGWTSVEGSEMQRELRGLRDAGLLRVLRR